MSPLERFKRPDKKNALSLLEASNDEMKFTLKMEPSEASATTIIRNIYESFRMLGDTLLILRGIGSHDHLRPINELMTLKVETKRPIRTIENLRQFRHNINYYGYRPKLSELMDVIEIAKACFKPIYTEIKRQILSDNSNAKNIG